MVLILYVFNVWGAKAVPQTQNVLLVVHVIAFVVIMVILWVKSPHVSAEVVFTRFTNEGGWSSMGVSLMIGQITAIYALFCA